MYGLLCIGLGYQPSHIAVPTAFRFALPTRTQMSQEVERGNRRHDDTDEETDSLEAAGRRTAGRGGRKQTKVTVGWLTSEEVVA